MVTIPMVKNQGTEQNPLPSKYRVLAWDSDHGVKFWVYWVIPDMKMVYGIRPAASFELDEYFPFMLLRVWMYVAERVQPLQRALQDIAGLLQQWGVVAPIVQLGSKPSSN